MPLSVSLATRRRFGGDDFAIDVALDAPGRAPPGVWGSMCVRCHGAPLGRPDEQGCALFPARHGFADLVRRLDAQWDDGLAGLSDAALLSALDAARERGESRFDLLTGWGEPFDGFGAYAIAPPGEREVWIVSAQLPTVVAVVARDHFSSAACDFVAWFDSVALTPRR